MATGELEPVIQAKRPSANTVAPPAEELTVLPSPPVHLKVNDDDEPPSPVAAPRPVLDAATLSYRSTRKELISVFVACTNLNLPQLPQTFFQSIFKGKTPDSNLPEIRVEVDIKPTSDANKSSSVFHNTTEALRVRNPSFSMGLTIPVPISKANSEEYHLYFRVVQTDVGMEKTVATTEMMCGVLLESFKQGSPVVHLPLLTNASHEAILSLTLARVFPIKHNVLPTQNMLMHMYSFDEPKRKDPSSHLVAEKTPLLASEELVEVGYVTSLPPIFLQQCTDEMVAAHRLWSVRYANARKSALLFESPDEALANGCDVYAVEVISGKGLTLPAELNLQPAPAAPVTPTHRTISANSSSGTRSRSSSNASKESTKQPVVTCNPFVAVKFKETTKGKRPVEVTEGRTSVEKNTSEPHWGENNSTVGGTRGTDDGESSMTFVVGKAQTNGIQFYRPNEGQPAHSLRRTLEFDVLSQCDAHFDGEIALGHVTLPIDAVMYEGKSAVWDINLTRWLPVITPTGEERGEILIRLQMRRTTTVFSLDKEPAFAPGSLFRLADPKRHAKWQSTLEASNYNPSSLSISEIRDLVASHESAIAQLRTWQHHVETTSTEWFRSSELKAKLEVQPLTTNLHVSYFRLYAGQAPARATVLEGRPRDVEIGLLPGDELSASTRNMLGRGGGGGGSRFSLEDLVDHDSPLQVNATYATVTCGAPTAHGLGLSQFGLVELEDRLLSVDMPIESYQCTYAVRKAVCMSQALSVLVAAFSTQLELVLQKSVPNHEWLLEQWIQVGFLLGWESLVSTQGKELHMLSDAWVAIKSMERIQIQLVPHCELMTFAPSPDTDNKYILQLPVPSSVFGLLPQVLQDGGLIAVTSVLFTQGINEMQTLANVVGAVGIALQVRINDKCCAALAKYHEKLMAVPSLQGMTAQMKDIKLDALTTLIANSNESTMTKKNHRILLEASDTIRRLNGGRVTFCKSGKDRTAMSVTLDQARVIGSTWKHVPMMIQEGTSKQDWAVLKPVANLMREFGVRIEVAKKNVGHPRYSFNGLQRKMLPKIYRPPRGAIIKGDHDVDDS